MLLEGLLKVGLISLNEQAIEMLLATIVYPMLLQPLLLPGHQYSSAPGENKESIVQLQREEDEKDGEEASAAVEDKNLSSIISLHSSAPFYSIIYIYRSSKRRRGSTANVSSLELIPPPSATKVVVEDGKFASNNHRIGRGARSRVKGRRV